MSAATTEAAPSSQESSPPSSQSVNSPPQLPEKERVPLSCTKAFDSLYYCYSPFHQGREYYIRGELDDCRGRLKRFRMCVMSRFRPQSDSEQLYEEEERLERAREDGANARPVWEFREEYLERIRDEEMKEKQEVDAQREKEAEGTANWWL